MGDSSVADYVYLMKPSSLQDGTVNDFVAYFHNGDEWKSLDNESSSDNFGDLVIPPDHNHNSGRQGNPLDLLLSGTAALKVLSWIFLLSVSGCWRIIHLVLILCYPT